MHPMPKRASAPLTHMGLKTCPVAAPPLTPFFCDSWPPQVVITMVSVVSCFMYMPKISGLAYPIPEVKSPAGHQSALTGKAADTERSEMLQCA